MSHTSDHGAPKTSTAYGTQLLAQKRGASKSSVEVDPMARRKAAEDGGRWVAVFFKMFCVGPFVSGR